MGWSHEAADFTNWLAEEENLRILSDAIGVEMRLIQTEASVGKFNADILAQEEGTENKIIIENQLEDSDHNHLGKVITYASGFDARMAIWIVKEAREEHRQAIDWLNEHTDEETAFFLLQIELWQIGDSPLAPKFEVISKPNDWAKTVKQSVSSGATTEIKTRQLEFWEQFKSFARSRGSSLRIQKPSPQHWLDITVGSSLAHISLTLNSIEEAIRTELYITNTKELYRFLEHKKEEIENSLGERAEWMELPGKKASRIKVEISGSIDNTEQWEGYFDWLLKSSEQFHKVFSPLLSDYKQHQKGNLQLNANEM